MTLSPDKARYAVQLYQEGMSVKAICKELRMGQETLYRYIHIYRVPLHQPRKPVDPKSRRFIFD